MSVLLDARLRLLRDSFVLDVSLSLAEGEVLALLGPNGSGKSTVLNLIAGLALPDSGTVSLDGRALTGPGVNIPPERRDIGLLGQEPLLFPHLSARENVAFPLRAARVSKPSARKQADDWLDRVGLGDCADSRPVALSGGQQQRVALARALAASPRLLLLDEPFASLDAETAPVIRHLLREQLAATGMTTIVVTHDVVDAVVLADRVAVMHAGSVVDEGATATVLEAPRNHFVAALAGVNLVVGSVVDGAVRAPDGRIFQARQSNCGALGVDSTGADSAAAVVFRPGAVVVGLERPRQASPRNVWSATVTRIDAGSSGVRLHTSGSPEVVAEVTPGAVAELGIRVGSLVWLSVKATEVNAHLRP